MRKLPYVAVVALSPESALEFFGFRRDDVEGVEDVGPPSRPERFKPEARRFHIILKDKKGNK